MTPWPWPDSEDDLVEVQLVLAGKAAAAMAAQPWALTAAPLIAGCFAAYARGEAGPGHPGDRVWAAAVAWRPPVADNAVPEKNGADPARRRPGAVLRGATLGPDPRQAIDVQAQAVVAGQVPAAYAPGLLARREGPILDEALRSLPDRPDVIMVDATGLDHPRRAGLAIHLGALLDLPSIGVTHRPLVGLGVIPELRRGAMAAVRIGDSEVARWVCTRDRSRPVLAHAGWRTDPSTAARLVLLASTPAARTPVPLQEARRVAREARALAGAGRGPPGPTDRWHRPRAHRA
jgi:deoxyribonuclease V